MNLLRLKQLVVVLALVLLTNGLTARITRAESLVAKSIMSTETEDVKYLGDGFNTVQKDYVYGNMALEFPDGALVYDGVSSESKYCFVSSKKELEENFFSGFRGSIGVSFPGVTAMTGITKTIEESTSFSAEKVTIIAYWRQIDKKVYVNGLPKLKDSALAILQSDPKRFMQLYGDRYINGVTLGKMFYIVYQADVSSVAESNRSSVTKAVELSYKKIAGGSLTTSEETFMSEKLTNVKIESKAYAVGLSGFIGPYSADDFKNIQYQVGQGQSTPIEITLKDYSYTSNYGGNSFFNSSDYYKMANEWEQHLSLLKYITSNNRISSSLKEDCVTAYNYAITQLEMVYALDSNARYPGSDISVFKALYNRYITELQIKQQWYTFNSKNFLYGKTLTFDYDLTSIGDVEFIRIYLDVDGDLRPEKYATMYINDSGSFSEFKNMTIYDDTTLYEGIKLSNTFRISGGAKGASKVYIIVQYQPRMTDLIWLYLKKA